MKNALCGYRLFQHVPATSSQQYKMGSSGQRLLTKTLLLMYRLAAIVKAFYAWQQKSGLRAQMILAMKLTFILLTAAMLSVQASGVSQNITLDVKDASLERIFTLVKKQTSYVFFYKKEDLSNAKSISIQVDDLPIDVFLKKVLSNQNLDFLIKNHSVIIYRKPQVVQVTAIKEMPEEEIVQPITGIIHNANTSEPLAGASITLKGTKQVVVTDNSGNFSINADVGQTLVISHVGFQSREIRISSNSIGIITLNPSITGLDEVQVIAYGTTTKRLSTANVSTVKAEDIAKSPVSNPLLALQGRVPGILISQASGKSGAALEVQIQGKNSWGQGTQPFFVVDGVPYPNSLTIWGGSPIGRGNPFNYFNPADIESIDVLKDADATSIYGSRAANGAILITTKKGKAGRTKVEINAQHGWKMVGHRLKLLNTQQYIEMRREALRNDGESVSFTDYDINGVYDTTRYTDWQEELIGGKAQYSDIQASVSGGNDNTQFLVSGAYHRETTVCPENFADRKGSVYMSLTHSSVNKKLKLLVNSSYMIDDNKMEQRDLTEFAMYLVPQAPALFRDDGELNWEPLPDGTSSWINPLAYLNHRYFNKTGNLLINTAVSYELFKGLELKTSFGFSKLQTDETSLEPITMFRPEDRPLIQRSARFAHSYYNSWIVEPQVSYKRNVFQGKLTALVGVTIDQRHSNSTRYNAIGFASDAVMLNPQAATSINPDATEDAKYKYNAIFGQLNYNWLDKYIINLSARRDGSSRFGSENLFNNFSSVGFTWLFSNEPLIKKLSPVLSFGKLRASYGTTGNDQIGDYSFMSLYHYGWQERGYQDIIRGISPNKFANPYLQWEETKKLNVGTMLGFFSDRVVFDVNYYHYRSSNQLLAYFLPRITGFGDIVSNFPATLQNTGWEISLNTTNISLAKFQWKTGFNITFRKNKLVEFPDLETSSYGFDFKIGQPITIRRLYHYLGVDPSTGLYSFEDSHGKPTSYPDYMKDANIIMNTEPKFYGGLQNTFIYKNMQLDVLFNFVEQKGMDYSYGSYPGYFSSSSFPAGNQPVSVLDRWQTSGDKATVQRYNSNFSTQRPFMNLGGSDAAFTDASYIKLKNISFSWMLPKKMLQDAHIQDARIFVQGQNLFTITNYYGLDPETRSSTTLPSLRTITIGCQITL